MPILLADGTFYGTLCAVDPEPQTLAQPQIDLLVVLARLLATQLERDRAEEALRQAADELEGRVRERTARLALLTEIGRELSAELDLDRLLTTAWRHLPRVVAVRDCWLALWDEPAGELDYRLYVTAGRRRPDAERRSVPGRGLAWALLTERATVRVPDYPAECRRRGLRPAGPDPERSDNAWLGVPLVTGGRVVGAMAVWRYGEPFSAADAATLEGLAGQMAAALDNARLHTAIQRELAERERAEAALRESQRFIRRVADTTPDFVYVYDLAVGRNVYVNRELPILLGYTPEMVRARGEAFFPMLLHPADRARFSAHLAQLARLADGEIVETEYRLRHADGTWRWLYSRDTVFQRAADGTPTQILGTARDVTVRKRAEEALRESEERHRTLFAAAERQARELALLHQVRTALAGEWELPVLFRTVVEAIAATFGYTQVGLYLRQGDVLVLQHQVGYSQVIERIPVSAGVSGRVVRTGEAVLLPDVRRDPAFLGAIEGIVSEICVPLRDEGGVIGVLNVESTDGVTLTEADLQLMTALSDHVGLAIGRARLYTRVRESEERFRSLVQNASDIIVLVDADATCRYVSPSIEQTLGYPPAELVGLNIFQLVHPDDVALAERRFAESLGAPGVALAAEFRMRHCDGTWRYLEALGNNRLDDPAVRAIVVNARDITERKGLEARLAHRATHDPLTGLANRALLADRIGQALTRAARRGGAVAVLFVDLDSSRHAGRLDSLKAVNNRLGHDAGDQFLVTIAARLRACLRPGDTAARLGGDEFVLVLAESAGVEEAARVADQVREHLAAPFIIAGQTVSLSASVGIALSAAGHDTPAALLQAADQAMYRAKEAGKARYAVFGAGDEAVAMQP